MLTLPLLFERGRVIINDFHTFYHCRVNKIVLYYFEMLQFFQYLFRFFSGSGTRTVDRKWDKWEQGHGHHHAETPALQLQTYRTNKRYSVSFDNHFFALFWTFY